MAVKRFLTAITLLVYFTVSTGFVVSAHYCMNRFDFSQVGSSDDSHCHKCGMEKKDGCCRDEVKVVKMTADQLAGKVLQPTFSPLLPAVAVAQPPVAIAQTSHAPGVVSNNGPPLTLQQRLSLLSVFRI